MVKLILNERELQAKQGMMIVLSFFVLFLCNTLALYFANLLFPNNVVLGTFALTPFWALMLAGGKLTVISLLVMLLVPYKEWKTKKDLKPTDWMKLYFVVNAVSLYLVTRFAEIYGLGVSSWVVIIALALFMDVVQGMTMMQLGKVKIK